MKMDISKKIGNVLLAMILVSMFVGVVSAVDFCCECWDVYEDKYICGMGWHSPIPGADQIWCTAWCYDQGYPKGTVCYNKICCPDGRCRPEADLSASLSADSPVNSGDTFNVKMTVSNAAGSATANNVAPSSLSVNTLTGDASASCGGHSPTSANIPGGSSHDFTWICTASGEEGGTLKLSASASGTDACSGETVTASSTTSNTVTVEVPEFLFGLLIPLMSSVLIYFTMRSRIKKR